MIKKSAMYFAVIAVLNASVHAADTRLDEVIVTGTRTSDPVGVGGMAWKVFISFMGLVVATLSITGVMLWWRKRKVLDSVNAL